LKLHVDNINSTNVDAPQRSDSLHSPVAVLTMGDPRRQDVNMVCVFALLVTVCMIFLMIFLPLVSTATAEVNAGANDSPFIAVSEAVRPAVVNIRIIKSVNAEGVGTQPLQEMYRQFFPDEEGKGGRFESPSTGSGFVVSADGDILTNHHVIANADAIFVRFSGEKRE